MVATNQAQLRSKLHARGLRGTPQRELVLGAVQRLGHATPEEICTAVQQDFAAVNITTVYRTLELLEELELVRHTHLGHGAPRYSTDAHQHLHLVCHHCGGVTEADPGLSAPLARELLHRHGFRLDPAHLALSGCCRACAGSTSDQQQPVTSSTSDQQQRTGAPNE